MKFNKWTLGLAAVGAVSMASAVRADEAKLSQLNTAISNTTISGCVDVAAQYNLGNPGKYFAPNTPAGLSSSKVDGFSVNDVLISLDKPLDESPWASGYHIDFNTGNDAIYGGDSYLRQGYVTMRTPVGNGIDWKMGVWDGVTGYEVNTGYLNPNYTRSYGYGLNPTTELGLLGTYKICNEATVMLGIGNRGFGSGHSTGLSSKNYIGALALTAPESFGFLKGSVLNFGTVQTFDNGGYNNYSVNATLATPVAGLKVGLSYDKVQGLGIYNSQSDGNVFGVYATYQATDKLSFNLRGEYVDGQNLGIFSNYTSYPYYNGEFTTSTYGNVTSGKGEEVTATIQYDLWANVTSRLEFRWDHTESGLAFNNGTGYVGYPSYTYNPSTESAFQIALNVVYKF